MMRPRAATTLTTKENRITGAAGYTYTYDADGNRVEKSNGSTGTIYWPMSPGIVAESDLSGNLQSEYVFFDGKRVGRKDFSRNTTSISYYFSDELKTADVITDSAGTTKSESDYYPYGGELPFVSNDSNHYKHNGKERDAETGLDYYGARHYSSSLSRFITPDWSSVPVPVPYADLTNPQTLNQYAFAHNNPTSLEDSDGHETLFSSDKAEEDFSKRMEPIYRWVVKALNHPAVQAYLFVGLGAGGGAEGGAGEGAAGAREGATAGAEGGAANGVREGAAAGTKEGVSGAGTATPKEGIYEGPDATAPGKTYVGQSKNIPQRLVDHEKAGKFAPGTKTRPLRLKGERRPVRLHNKRGLTSWEGLDRHQDLKPPIFVIRLGKLADTY